jgi:hypothetical protein
MKTNGQPPFALTLTAAIGLALVPTAITRRDRR